MTKWVKDNEGTLQYATDTEFEGIPNWSTHEAACRAKGYFPLEGTPEPREGYTASPSAWHVDHRTETHVEPRQVRVDDWEEDPVTHERRVVGWHYEMRDTEITLDKSAIVVDEWAYAPIPVPTPPPKEYSKLRLYDALVSAGIWTEVKTAIEAAGQWERWELANDLATDYAPFAQLLAQLRQTYGDELVDSILSQAEI